jgi:hypothetical protein
MAYGNPKAFVPKANAWYCDAHLLNAEQARQLARIVWRVRWQRRCENPSSRQRLLAVCACPSRHQPRCQCRVAASGAGGAGGGGLASGGGCGGCSVSDRFEGCTHVSDADALYTSARGGWAHGGRGGGGGADGGARSSEEHWDGAGGCHATGTRATHESAQVRRDEGLGFGAQAARKHSREE